MRGRITNASVRDLELNIQCVPKLNALKDQDFAGTNWKVTSVGNIPMQFMEANR